MKNYGRQIEEAAEQILKETFEIATDESDALRIVSEHLAITHLFIDERELVGEYEEWLNEMNISLVNGEFDEEEDENQEH